MVDEIRCDNESVISRGEFHADFDAVFRNSSPQSSARIDFFDKLRDDDDFEGDRGFICPSGFCAALFGPHRPKCYKASKGKATVPYSTEAHRDCLHFEQSTGCKSGRKKSEGRNT